VTSGPTGSSARARGLEDPYLVSGCVAPVEGLTLGSQLACDPTSGCIATTRRARGPATTLELISTGTSVLVNTREPRDKNHRVNLVHPVGLQSPNHKLVLLSHIYFVLV
jgi:hypothetical protein